MCWGYKGWSDATFIHECQVCFSSMAEIRWWWWWNVFLLSNNCFHDLLSGPHPEENQNRSRTREKLGQSLETWKPSPLTCTLENKITLRYTITAYIYSLHVLCILYLCRVHIHTVCVFYCGWSLSCVHIDT